MKSEASTEQLLPEHRPLYMNNSSEGPTLITFNRLHSTLWEVMCAVGACKELVVSLEERDFSGELLGSLVMLRETLEYCANQILSVNADNVLPEVAHEA